MNQLQKILIGLQIFEKHGGSTCPTEHDQIWSGQAEGENLSAEEIKALADAGWFIDSEFCQGDCREEDTEAIGFTDEDDDTKHHPSCDQWTHFV